MKYVADQITDVKADANNQDSFGASSVPTSDILRFLNYAQESIQATITATNPMTFVTERIIPVLVGVSEYGIPDRVFQGERLVNVEFSRNGQLRDYYKLEEQSLSLRSSEPGNFTSFYTRRSGKILLDGGVLTSGGTLRVNYERQLDSLDIRRGTITASTVAAGSVTSITLDIANDDAAALATAQFLCVNDLYGNVLAYNIPISAYNSTTGVVTIRGGTFALQAGETVPVGAFVTIGAYTTTHSKLTDLCERFLVLHATYATIGRDNAAKGRAAYVKDLLDQAQADIEKAFQTPDKDDHHIQIENDELMFWPTGWR